LKNPRYTLSKRLSGPQCWSGYFGEGANPLALGVKIT